MTQTMIEYTGKSLRDLQVSSALEAMFEDILKEAHSPDGHFLRAGVVQAGVEIAVSVAKVIDGWHLLVQLHRPGGEPVQFELWHNTLAQLLELALDQVRREGPDRG